MKIFKLLTYLLILLLLFTIIGAISASDSLNGQDNIQNSIDESFLDANLDNNNVSYGKTITVEPDENNPNEMVNPTVQPAIDAANPGDTIILKGDFYHCHFLINKQINIIAAPETTLGPCPHYQTEDAGSFGVFYVNENGSGSVFKGINFINSARAETPFSFLIRGAKDITISNCSMDYPETDDNKFQGIIIENSDDIKVDNSIINRTLQGMRIINSSNIEITDCIISNSLNQAVAVIGNSSNISIKRNSLDDNQNCAIRLESAKNIMIENNLIRNNGLNDGESESGIYVNTLITKLVVKGNVFINNALHAILYDYRCRNLNNDEGADLLTDVDNNYFEGHKSMILHHRIYVERDYGDLRYDAENDVYGNVGEGSYIESNTFVYMKNALIFNDIPCGFTYYTIKIPWNQFATGNDGKYDFYLKLNLKQIKNGVYQVAIIDSKGNIARDFDSISIPVFLNAYSTVIPQEGDIFRYVLLENGVGIADFRDSYADFNTTGNIVTAAFPGISKRVSNSHNAQLKIEDSNVPIDPSTKLTASKLTTFPLSDNYLSVKLTDSKGKAVSDQTVTFKFNGKTYSAKTDANGIAKVKVSLSTKRTYAATITYAGSDDYMPSKTTADIRVKTGSKKSKISASNMKVKKNSRKTFKLILKNSAGKALKNQKIIVKVNGKSSVIKTNSKGIAKLSIKLKQVKKYKITMKFLGNANYKSTSKTNVITVTR